jgi:hypothetical protein
MNELVFTLVFQVLGLWGLCCLALAVLTVLPLPESAVRRLLLRISKPAVKATAFISPAIIPPSLHVFLASVWLLTLRVCFFLSASALNLLPAGA